MYQIVFVSNSSLFNLTLPIPQVLFSTLKGNVVKMCKGALDGWLSCLEYCPIHQKGCGYNPQSGVYGRELTDIFLSFLLSLKSIRLIDFREYI